MDLRLRERRLELPFFALRRLDERRDFLLPPFFADAFLRDERLLGAMVRSYLRLHVRHNCDLNREATMPQHQHKRIKTSP